MAMRYIGADLLGAAKNAIDKAMPREAKDAAAKIKKKVDDSGLQANLEKTVHKTFDVAKSTVDRVIPQDAKDKAAELKKIVDNSEVKRNLEKTFEGTIDSALGAVKKITGEEDELVETGNKPVYVSKLGVITILYYFICADGNIDKDKMDQFDIICKEVDPDHDIDIKRVSSDCNDSLSQSLSGERIECITRGIDRAADIQEDGISAIDPKSLIWDMLNIAYNSDNYTDNEKDIVKYTAQKYSIDDSVVLEMEHTLLTMIDIENELEWIKKQKKTYFEIENVVSELNTRKEVAIKSIQALVTL